VNDKRMTVREIADATGAAYRTVADYARKAGWTKNGKQTLLDEKQVALIVEAMKVPVPSGTRVKMQKRMAVGEMASLLGCSPETIKSHIRVFFPSLMRNGFATYLTEEQATVILEKMKTPSSSGTLANLQAEIAGVETGQSRALRMWNLHNQMRDLYEAEIADLKSQNMALARDLSANRRLLDEREIGLAVIQRIAEAGGLMMSDRDDVTATYGRRVAPR